MSDARVVVSDDYVVTLDYSTFDLLTGDVDPDDYVHVLDHAQDGIGQLAGIVSITSPLRVEVWHAEPPSDIEAWQEAFEAHLDVGDTGRSGSSPQIRQLGRPDEWDDAAP